MLNETNWEKQRQDRIQEVRKLQTQQARECSKYYRESTQYSQKLDKLVLFT